LWVMSTVLYGCGVGGGGGPQYKSAVSCGSDVAKVEYSLWLPFCGGW